MTVHPGAICSPIGAEGQTKLGTNMVCRLPATGGKHARWGRRDPAPRSRRRRGGPRRHQGLERRYIRQYAEQLADPAALLPTQLVDQIDDKQVGALRRALGWAGIGRNARRTDLEKLDEAGLLQDGKVTTRGVAALQHLHEAGADSMRLTGDEQHDLDRYLAPRPRSGNQPAAPAEDRSGQAGTDWSRYDACPTCQAGAGTPCRDLRSPGSVNATAHDGRPWQIRNDQLQEGDVVLPWDPTDDLGVPATVTAVDRVPLSNTVNTTFSDGSTSDAPGDEPVRIRPRSEGSQLVEPRPAQPSPYSTYHGDLPDPDAVAVAAGKPGAQPSTDVEQAMTAIRTATARLANRNNNTWVGLADLRDELGDRYNRATVDEALRKLSHVGSGVLVEEETNQKTLTQRDRAAAVVIGDRSQHVISVGES